MNRKLIVILGPTACGKTKLAVRLAAKYQGEIISADSRQVYRGMDIGTGKDLADYVVKNKSGKKIKIPYHLIDVVSPKTDYNVSKYQKAAYRAVEDVLSREKTPFLTGGTGLYLDAVTKGYVFGLVDSKKSKEVRDKLNKLTLPQLLLRLKKVDSKIYQAIDQKNRRRVQRALEIYLLTGKSKADQPARKLPDYEILTIGIKFPIEVIYEKIAKRMKDWFKHGMIEEVERLRKEGVSWKRLDSFGLEYRYVVKYLRGQMDYESMLIELEGELRHFAKRQLTWFKRDENIVWIEDLAQIERLVDKFLKR